MTLPKVKPSDSLQEFLKQIAAITKHAPVTGLFVAIELQDGQHITTHQHGLSKDAMIEISKLAKLYHSMKKVSS